MSISSLIGESCGKLQATNGTWYKPVIVADIMNGLNITVLDQPNSYSGAAYAEQPLYADLTRLISKINVGGSARLRIRNNLTGAVIADSAVLSGFAASYNADLGDEDDTSVYLPMVSVATVNIISKTTGATLSAIAVPSGHIPVNVKVSTDKIYVLTVTGGVYNIHIYNKTTYAFIITKTMAGSGVATAENQHMVCLKDVMVVCVNQAGAPRIGLIELSTNNLIDTTTGAQVCVSIAKTGDNTFSILTSSSLSISMFPYLVLKSQLGIFSFLIQEQLNIPTPANSFYNNINSVTLKVRFSNGVYYFETFKNSDKEPIILQVPSNFNAINHPSATDTTAEANAVKQLKVAIFLGFGTVSNAISNSLLDYKNGYFFSMTALESAGQNQIISTKLAMQLVGYQAVE